VLAQPNDDALDALPADLQVLKQGAVLGDHNQAFFAQSVHSTQPLQLGTVCRDA
jgi:hypothetical protein